MVNARALATTNLLVYLRIEWILHEICDLLVRVRTECIANATLCHLI